MARMSVDDNRLAEAYYRIGSQASREGNTQASLQAFAQALDAARRTGNLTLQAEILPFQVANLTAEGDMRSACDLVGPALEIAGQTGDENILARALNNVALYYQSIGDGTRSVHLMQQQIKINQQQGNHLGEAIGLINLGYIYLSMGRFETAQGLLEHALHTARNLRARIYIAYGLLNLGLAEWRLGEPQRACQTLKDSLPILETLGDLKGQATCRFYLGLACEKGGGLSEACEQFEAARKSFKSLDVIAQMVEAQAGLARLALRRSDLLQAGQHAMHVSSYLEEHGSQGLELPTLVYLSCAMVFQALGDNPRLQKALENGRKELQTRLDQISEADWRTTFLEAIPENRDLLAFKSTVG
jgi:tetratricopeptide (TPR) repeat protein